MIRADRQPGAVLAAGVSILLVAGAMGGCYVAAEGELPPAVVLVMRGVIVDLNPEAGTVTVKKDETYETWQVAVVASTRVRAGDGRYLELADLRLGERIELRGTSRVLDLITVYEIISLEDHPEEKNENRSNW
jgi:hypothetical protein